MGFHPYNPPNKEEQEFLLDPTGDASDLPESKIQFFDDVDTKVLAII